MAEKIWTCKIGATIESELPPGSDYPMRQAVEMAFREVTGRDSEFLFSGWGGSLTESERKVVDSNDE
jgi:hypothetical protein